MANLKDQLIKLGNSNPNLRDHLRPILDILKTASKDKAKKWIARDTNHFLSKLQRMGLRNLREDVQITNEEHTSHGWTLEAYMAVHLEEYSLKELADVLNSREGREAVTFRNSFYPITEEKLNSAIDEPVLLGGEHEGELEDLALIADFTWDSY